MVSRSWRAVTLWPLACAKPAAMSRAPELEPCEARRMISAAVADCGTTPAPAAASRPAAAALNHFLIASSRCSRFALLESRLGRLHVGLAEQRPRFRRDHELDHRTRSVRLL